MIKSIFENCISSLKSDLDSKIIINECYIKRLNDFLKRREIIDSNFNHILEEVIQGGDIRLISYIIGRLPNDNECILTFLRLYKGGF